MFVWSVVHQRAQAATEALNWKTDKQDIPYCLYGEITVLSTIQGMYYCGAQFEQGYTGIQHLDHNLHTALFSIWDTSPNLQAKIIKSGPGTRMGRFGGEGNGSHLNVDGSWMAGKTYRFFLLKKPGKFQNTTDTSFYVAANSSSRVVDSRRGNWRHVATITTPNGPKHVGENFHAGVSSWIENIGGGANFKTPKIVLYDLWLGSNLHEMKRLTCSGGQSGSGRWGQLHNRYFLAEGSAQRLNAAFSKMRKKFGMPIYGKDGKELAPIPEKPISTKTISELESVL